MGKEAPIKSEPALATTIRNHQKHRARIAYLLIWASSTTAMFITVAFMLLLTDVDPKNLYFYLPVCAAAVIIALVIPITANIAKHYSS